MSRIGNRIITVPADVTVENVDNVVTVKGPKGTLSQVMLKDITMKQEENTIILERKNESAKAMHGTMNALIQNMIIGVTNRRLHISKTLYGIHNGIPQSVLKKHKKVMLKKMSIAEEKVFLSLGYPTPDLMI